MAIRGIAKQRIPYGAHVLCRGNEVSLAGPEIANGIADKSEWWPRAWPKGEWVKVTPIQGLGQRDLHAMANGPIMEPLRLYLPAGKISEEEYQERLDLDFQRAGITRDK